MEYCAPNCCATAFAYLLHATRKKKPLIYYIYLFTICDNSGSAGVPCTELLRKYTSFLLHLICNTHWLIYCIYISTSDESGSAGVLRSELLRNCIYHTKMEASAQVKLHTYIHICIYVHVYVHTYIYLSHLIPLPYWVWTLTFEMFVNI